MKYPRVADSNLHKADLVLDKVSKKHQREIVRDLSIETLDVIPFGLPTLDTALGCGGLPRGRLIEFNGPPSSGKCVTVDTLIPVEGHGTLRLRELLGDAGIPNEDSLEPGKVVEHTVGVCCDAGVVETVGLYYAGLRPTTTVETEHGHTIQGTDKHRVLAFGGMDHPGIAHWECLRAFNAGDIVLTAYGFRATAETPIKIVPCGNLPSCIDTVEGAAFFGGLVGVEPRITSFALTSTSSLAQKAFRDWGDSLGLQDVVDEIPRWTRVTGLVRLQEGSKGLVRAAVDPRTLASVRKARLDLQAAWVAGLLLQKGRWSHDDLEVELWSLEVAETLQTVAENLGIRMTRYWTLSPHDEDGCRYKLAIRSYMDQQTAQESLWRNIKTPKEWRKCFVRDEEEENYNGCTATLAAARQLCLRLCRDDVAKKIELDDLSKENFELVEKLVSPLAQLQDASLVATLGILASPNVTWDRVTQRWRSPRAHCWDYSVPNGSRLATNTFLSHNSTLALEACRQEFRHNEGAYVHYFDLEGSMPTKYVNMMGLKRYYDQKRFRLHDVRSADEIDEILNLLLHKDVRAVPSLVVVDSIAALKTEENLARGIGEGGVGADARANAQIAPKWNSIASTYGTTFILINQLRDVIFMNPFVARAALRTPGMMGLENQKSAGGNAWKFFHSMIIRLDVKELKYHEVLSPSGDRDKEIYASRVRAFVTKNKADVPMRSASFYITFGRGVDHEQTLFRVGLAHNVIIGNNKKENTKSKSEGWFRFVAPNGQEIKYKGEEAFVTALRTDQSLCRSLKQTLGWDDPHRLTGKSLGFVSQTVSDSDTEAALDLLVEDGESTEVDLKTVEALTTTVERAHALGIIECQINGLYVWNCNGNQYRLNNLSRFDDKLVQEDRESLERLVVARLTELREQVVTEDDEIDLGELDTRHQSHDHESSGLSGEED